MKQYESVIGLEIHVQLNTASKMFCACSNADSGQPNLNICPVCLGMPGMLPVANKDAIEKAILTALALGCEINLSSKFDRKHYMYPDLPKGYQISQYDKPFGINGSIELELTDGTKKTVRIHRLHLEEDAGKLIHAADESLVDLNRAGTPLIEVVSEADLRSAEEARLFATHLRSIVRYLGVSDADMERGNMRFDANISVREAGTAKFGTKTEIKNMNSFRFMERALAHEIERQTALLEAGESVVAETRGWDESKGLTTSQRTKEEAQDYRYFPEPDLPPVIHTQDQVEEIRRTIPELPNEKQARFEREYGLSPERGRVRVEDKEAAAHFESAIEHLSADPLDTEKLKKAVKRLDSILGSAEAAYAKDHEGSLSASVAGKDIAIVIEAVINGSLSSTAAVSVLVKTADGSEIEALLSQNSQQSDESELGKWADEAIKANPKAAEDFKAGNERAIAALVGYVMKQSQGKANPGLTQRLLKERLQR